MGFSSFRGGFKVGAGFKPDGDSGFPLMESCDIQVTEDGIRLDEYLKTLGDTGGGGGLTEEQLKQFNDLVTWYKESNYVAMTGTFTVTPNTTVYDMRTSTFDVKFKWTFDKMPSLVMFNINGVDEIQELAQEGERTVFIGSPEDTKLTYKIYAEYHDADLDKTDKVSKTITIEFHNRRYQGYAPQPTEINSDFITSLSNNALVSSRKFSFTSTCSDDCYIWYAYPARYGTATMKTGDYQGGFEPVQTVSVTNQYGITEDYYVYRSIYKGVRGMIIQAT